MSGDEKENTQDILPSWLEMGTLSALLVPLFYTAGWSYAYHYFERFNLGLMGLDIPREYFFVYSFHAVTDQAWLSLLTLMGVAALLTLGRVWLKWMKKRGEDPSKAPRLSFIIAFMPVVVMPVLIFALFTAFYHFGEKAAGNMYDRQVKNDFDAYLRVQVWAKAPEHGEYSDEMAQAWREGCYRLLMRNTDHVFVFIPPKPGMNTPTDMIPSGNVETIRLLRANKSCP